VFRGDLYAGGRKTSPGRTVRPPILLYIGDRDAGTAGRTTFDYSGESATVTGSTKSIGRGVAEGLAAAGADIAISARTPEDVAETFMFPASDAASYVVATVRVSGGGNLQGG